MKDILLVTLLHGSFNVGWHVNFGECSLIYSTDIGFEEASSFWSVQLFFCFSLVILRVANLPERTETGLIFGSDKSVRALHS